MINASQIINRIIKPKYFLQLVHNSSGSFLFTNEWWESLVSSRCTCYIGLTHFWHNRKYKGKHVRLTNFVKCIAHLQLILFTTAIWKPLYVTGPGYLHTIYVLIIELQLTISNYRKYDNEIYMPYSQINKKAKTVYRTWIS